VLRNRRDVLGDDGLGRVRLRRSAYQRDYCAGSERQRHAPHAARVTAPVGSGPTPLAHTIGGSCSRHQLPPGIRQANASKVVRNPSLNKSALAIDVLSGHEPPRR